MKRNVFETIIGAIVLIIAFAFLSMAYQKGDVGKVDSGYEVLAVFNRVDGLRQGADVRIAGVKVGDLTKIDLDPNTYQAVGTLTIDSNVKIPNDTVAQISNESLLGGKFISLEVGGSDQMMKPGDKFEYTQAAANLEQLLGQAIFSGKDSGAKPADAPSAAPAATPQQ